MDLDDLQTFVEVANAGGVSPAARRLGLAKSIVSRRLLRLEEELGMRLLARTTRGAALTEAGATFREHAVRVLAEMDTACDAISPCGEVRGRLRIAAPISFGITHLAPVFAEMARRHPKLHVHACYSDRYVDLVGEGFDVGIRVGYLPDSNLVARRIGPIHGRPVASPAYVEAHGTPHVPDDLVHHEALMQGAEPWRFMVDGKISFIHPQGRFKADNGEALLAAAIAGLGVAMLPDFLTASFVAGGALVPLLPDYPIPEAGLSVVRPPGGSPPRKVHALTDILIEHFGRADHKFLPVRSPVGAGLGNPAGTTTKD